jgi:hypothetical protein
MKIREDREKRNISGLRRAIPTPHQKREQMTNDMAMADRKPLLNSFS